MTEVARPTMMQTLMVVLSIHVAAFIFFHLCHAVIFDESYPRINFKQPWLGATIVTSYQVILYAPSLLLTWMAFKTNHHRILLIITAAAALYSGHFLKYPLLTGFLYSIDHIDQYPTFLFDRLPVTDPRTPT